MPRKPGDRPPPRRPTPKSPSEDRRGPRADSRPPRPPEDRRGPRAEERPPRGPSRTRTPLARWRGGPVEKSGDRAVADLLARALSALGDEEANELTHGFHSWPARFHPLLARRLLEGTPGLPRGARVLDPFVGSGTTLVEAACRGAAGLGVDLNPLAVLLARLKATPWPPARRNALLAAAQDVATTVADEARASRTAAGRAAAIKPSAATRYDDPRIYPPHVYRELVALRRAIDAVADEALRGALLLVLSSIIVKVSLQRSDTDETIVERAIPRGAPTRHFARKADELVRRMADFAAAVPPGTPPADVRQGDARKLTHIADTSIDLVITSPPYLGTYDYTRHHLRRFGWLGLDPAALTGGEIGPRRGAADVPAAFTRWSRDVDAWVGEIARVLRPGARAYVLVGDSRLGATTVAGDEELARAAAKAGLTVVARAAQARPSLGPPRPGAAPQREHLVALARPKNDNKQ